MLVLIQWLFVEAQENEDAVAFVRTLLIAQAVITNIFISLNILINWL